MHNSLLPKIEVTQALSWWKKSKGLTGETSAYPLLFKTRFGIHTFGMRFPVDVVILKNNFIVKKLKENLRPNSIYMWNPVWDMVLELPIGMIGKFNLKKEARVEIKIIRRI